MKSNSLFNKQIYLHDAELFQDLTAAEIDALGEQMPVKEVGAGFRTHNGIVFLVISLFKSSVACLELFAFDSIQRNKFGKF